MSTGVKAEHNSSAVLHINRMFYGQQADEFCRRTGGVEMSAFQLRSIALLQKPFLAELPNGGKILDAGSGSGRDSETFQRMGYRITAIDACPEMVRATAGRGIDAQLLTFQEINFEEEFDGIWACASLLHVPHAEIPNVLRRLTRAARFGGVICISIKEGYGEEVARDGRFFSFFTLREFRDLLMAERELAMLKSWRDEDVLPCMPHAWLNFLVRRVEMPS